MNVGRLYVATTLVEFYRAHGRAPTEVEFMRKIRGDGWSDMQCAAHIKLAENSPVFKIEQFERKGIRRRRFVLDREALGRAKTSALILYEDAFWCAIDERDLNMAAKFAVAGFWIEHNRWPKPVALVKFLRDDPHFGRLEPSQTREMITDGVEARSIALRWDGEAARLYLAPGPFSRSEGDT